MAVHDWTRVHAGTFHDFYCSWITHLKEALNTGVLPSGYYALAEQHVGEVNPDVLTLSTAERPTGTPMPEGPIAVAEAPPKVSITMTPDDEATYRMARRTLAIRHRSGHRLIALVEIVSPGNKDRASSVRDFVDKAVAVMRRGIHLLLVDLLPPSPFDPQGMHAAIWAAVDRQVFTTPTGKPLTLAAYAADKLPRAQGPRRNNYPFLHSPSRHLRPLLNREILEVEELRLRIRSIVATKSDANASTSLGSYSCAAPYVEPIAVGSVLPEMPLFLDPEWYVNAPLEETYLAAYRGMPGFWRDVIEGRESPGQGSSLD